MKEYQWFVFVVMAAVSWGAYVPFIQHGQMGFGPKGNPNAPMRAFLFVGLAYFLMAILIPGLWLLTHHEARDDGFKMNGAMLSTIGGALGAMGALGVIFALKYGGKPLYVAPLVFAGAPIVNVIVAMLWDRSATAPRPLFFVGLLLAVIGAALVLLNRPESAAGPHAAQASSPVAHSSPG